MHIALADSNPGDRKQMERLLGRESDRRIQTTGVLYTETFGSNEALLASPIVYDVYFLDIKDEDSDSFDYATAIRQKSIMSPIVLCSDVKERLGDRKEPENVIYIDKPVKTDELTALMDRLIANMEREKVPTVELRNRNESFYIKAPDIVYITGDKYDLAVHMADGSVDHGEGFIENVWREVNGFGIFVPINNKTIVNMSRISRLSGHKCIMSDDTVLKISLGYMKMVRDNVSDHKEPING
ncbi:MAG: hypothetical protein K6G69_03540 [Lachnospiraceae bacterium]|nr:hypothetical protein [Lachnospiraceae bacterium]